MSNIPTPFITVGTAVVDVTNITSVWVTTNFFDDRTVYGRHTDGTTRELANIANLKDSEVRSFNLQFKAYRDSIYNDNSATKPILDYNAAFDTIVGTHKQIVSARRGSDRFAFFMTISGDKKKQVEYGVLTDSDAQTAKLMGMLIRENIVVE